MSQYFDKGELFLEPKVKQYGSHMVMSNVHKPNKTKYVNIDTKFSDDYNNCSVANYNITLPERINDVKSITVTNLELPMSFYNISHALGNNCFKITNLDIDPTLPYLTNLSTGYINENNQFVDIIIIPDGYYTIDRLKNAINSQIDKVKRIPTNSNNYTVFNTDATISYDLYGEPLLLTDTNYLFKPDGSFIYVKDANDENIPDAYGNLQIQLKTGEIRYISDRLKNTNDLRFDYYIRESEGIQAYFYSTGSNIEIDFTVNDKGQFDKYNFKSKMGWHLGFRQLTYTILFLYTPQEGDYDPTDRLGPDGQPLTYGEFLVDLNSLRYVYLALEEFSKGSQNSFVSPTSSSLINKNIIARISLDRSNYGFGAYLPANIQNGLLLSDTRGYSGKIDLQKINIQILNDIGTPLPLNGYDFSLCLEVQHD
jgi:hypothetical protein